MHKTVVEKLVDEMRDVRSLAEASRVRALDAGTGDVAGEYVDAGRAA